jgi:hypothetical protein
MAESPIPGGRSFREVTGDKTDITLFNARWDWIKDDMLPAYRNLSPERRSAPSTGPSIWLPTATHERRASTPPCKVPLDIPLQERRSL